MSELNIWVKWAMTFVRSIFHLVFFHISGLHEQWFSTRDMMETFHVMAKFNGLKVEHFLSRGSYQYLFAISGSNEQWFSTSDKTINFYLMHIRWVKCEAIWSRNSYYFLHTIELQMHVLSNISMQL